MRRLALPLCSGMLVLGLVVGAVFAPPATGADAAKAKTPQEVLKLSFKRPAVRATLAQTVEELGKLAEVKIVVDWQALIETGVRPEATVSLPAAEATLEKLLEQVLATVATRGNPLAWCMIDDSVCVTTQARVLRRDRILTGSSSVTTRPAGAPPADDARAPAPPGGGNLSFDKTPLSDVMTRLQELSGVNFHVNYTALQTSGVDKTTPVTLRANDITVAKALDLITEELSGGKGKYDSVYWVVDDGMVKVTTGTALDTTVQTRVYDVGDLLMGVPNMEGPRLNLSMQTSNTANTTNNNQIFNPNTTNNQNTSLTPTVTKEEMQTKLAAIIQKSIGDDMWQPQGKGSISFLRNTMVISQTRLGFLLLAKSSALK